MAASPTNGQYAPNPGGVGDSPYATVTRAPPVPGAAGILDEFGRLQPNTGDPAFQPPQDPLKIGDPRDYAQTIYREIPNVIVQTGWDIRTTRLAIEQLVTGLFDAPSQLVDAIWSDSRFQSSMGSRTSGLLSRPIRFEVPARYKDSPDAQKCLDAWRKVWPTLGTEPVLAELQSWAVMMGFGIGQLLWDTSGEYWIPHLQVWNPRYTYYHWLYRKYIAITLDGQTPIEPGDAHWVLHTPHNPYRGWMRGTLRSIAPWWLARNYGLRDYARYSERHGMPIFKAKTPFGADPIQIQAWRNQLANIGQESILQLPTSMEANIGSYDLEYLEAQDGAWQVFGELITQCNTEITLALLGQNLTSEVKEGSFAAARIHADVRQTILEADARSLSQTIYNQISRPFAAMNFGDPDLAPKTYWDLNPYEDNKLAAETLSSFATALFEMRRAGFQVKDVESLARSMGLHLALGDIQDVPPLTTGGGSAGKEPGGGGGGKEPGGGSSK